MQSQPSLMMPKLSQWIPHKPTIKQCAFLLLPHREAFYGGAAGGGKSDALLMAALQYVDVPGFAAVMFRRTYADLSLPGALMDRAHEWLQGTAARWNGNEKTWTFPSGATITFGYLETEKDKFRYQGMEVQAIFFDELTQFNESQYLYLFSRLRRLEGVDIPLRMRAASNPGGEGHQWVYERFVAAGKPPDRIFIPARLEDNPYLDQDEYRIGLSNLDDTTRAQLLEGLWVTDPAGKPFKREWFNNGQNRFHTDDRAIVNKSVARWISWDTALKTTDAAAYTACTVGELTPDYRLNIRQVWRDKLEFPDLPDAILRMAQQHNADGKLRGIVIEDKVSGTSAYQTLMRTAPEWVQNMLFAFQPSGDKIQRAQQAAVWCKRNCVQLPFASETTGWLYDFESELFGAPDVTFMDQVDSFSQIIIYLENILADGHVARGEQ